MSQILNPFKSSPPAESKPHSAISKKSKSATLREKGRPITSKATRTLYSMQEQLNRIEGLLTTLVEGK